MCGCVCAYAGGGGSRRRALEIQDSRALSGITLGAATLRSLFARRRRRQRQPGSVVVVHRGAQKRAAAARLLHRTYTGGGGRFSQFSHDSHLCVAEIDDDTLSTCRIRAAAAAAMIVCCVCL